MKIIYNKRLKGLAQKISKALGQGGDGILFVGCGEANKFIKKKTDYSKCFELGKVTDNIDYLRRIILNVDTLEKDKSRNRQRKHPEKIVAQRFDFDCGWGAVCTILLMIGREEMLKTDVYGRLGVNPIDGTKSEKIKKFFEEEQIPYLEIWKASLEDVENIISSNGVILTSYQSEGGEEEIERMECGHYSLIFDIDDEFVWLIDPSWDEEYTPGLGKGVVKRTREEFNKRWIDKGTGGEIFDHWLLAVRLPVQE